MTRLRVPATLPSSIVRSLSPRCWIGALVVVFAVGSGAAHADTYALFSAVGSELAVVHFRGQTGSNLDPLARQSFAVPDTTFDTAALDALEQAIRKRDAQATFARLAVSDAKWITAVRRAAVDQNAALDGLIEPLVAAAANAGARQLVLVLPMHADVRLELAQTTMGRGRAAGLGMYVDEAAEISRGDTGATARGMLGLFANFRIEIVDTATKTRLDRAVATVGRGFSGARAPDANLLNALTAEQKVATFRRLIATGIENTLPPLLERTPR